MESKKLQRPRWLDSFLGPKNSKSPWLQDNLEEMNRNFRRMLKIIEDSNAESFSKKVEMYYESRQELINLVYKCYGIHGSLATRHNHATGEPLINIPNLDLIRSQIIISNVSSGKSIPRLIPLSKFPSSKQINAPVCSVSKQLKRRVSVKGGNYQTGGGGGQLVGRRRGGGQLVGRRRGGGGQLVGRRRGGGQTIGQQGYLKLQHEGTDELEAELCDMIEKLYIQMEGDRDVSKLQGKIWRHEDNASDYDGEFKKVKELASSNVDKAILEEKMELNVHSKEGLQNLQSQQRVKISTPPVPMPDAKKIIRFSLPYDSFSSSDDSHTHSDDDDGEELQHEGTDELEAELRDMIEKLYIEMEGDRVVSMLQGGRYEDNAHNEDDEEFRQVRESISLNVDKALLEQNLELQAEICRLLKDISSLEEYNEESNERCESLDEALSQAIEADTLFASDVEQLIVKKNNDIEELNKILEAVAAERDQLKARVTMLDADPYKS